MAREKVLGTMAMRGQGRGKGKRPNQRGNPAGLAKAREVAKANREAQDKEVHQLRVNLTTLQANHKSVQQIVGRARERVNRMVREMIAASHQLRNAGDIVAASVVEAFYLNLSRMDQETLANVAGIGDPANGMAPNPDEG